MSVICSLMIQNLVQYFNQEDRVNVLVLYFRLTLVACIYEGPLY